MNDATRKLLNLPLTIDPYVIPIIERKEKLASEKQERDEQDEQLDISDIIRKRPSTAELSSCSSYRQCKGR